MIDERYGEIHVEALPPMHVARYRAVSATPEEDASRRLEEWCSEHRLSQPCRHFGFDVEVPPDEAASGLRGYEAWTTVPADVSGDAEVSVADVGGGSFAVMTIREPFDDPFTWIPAGWQRLHEWVETNPWVADRDQQWLEELVEHDGHRDLVLLAPVR